MPPSSPRSDAARPGSSCARPAQSWRSCAAIRGAYRRTARRIARAQAQLALAAALLAASLAEPAFAGTPRFDNGVFGLANTASSAVPAFADIDGDGDLDAFVGERYGVTSFFENTGSAGAPAFAAPWSAPSASRTWAGTPRPSFVDIDGDGDLDAFIGERYGSTFFFENTGSAIAPAFGPPSANPFGLVNVGHTRGAGLRRHRRRRRPRRVRRRA